MNTHSLKTIVITIIIVSIAIMIKLPGRRCSSAPGLHRHGWPRAGPDQNHRHHIHHHHYHNLCMMIGLSNMKVNDDGDWHDLILRHY